MSAIWVADGKAWIAETCKGCGRCQSVCPQQAIDMHLEPVPAVQRGLLELMQRRTTFI